MKPRKPFHVCGHDSTKSINTPYTWSKFHSKSGYCFAILNETRFRIKYFVQVSLFLFCLHNLRFVLMQFRVLNTQRVHTRTGKRFIFLCSVSFHTQHQQRAAIKHFLSISSYGYHSFWDCILRMHTAWCKEGP